MEQILYEVEVVEHVHNQRGDYDSPSYTGPRTTSYLFDTYLDAITRATDIKLNSGGRQIMSIKIYEIKKNLVQSV